MPKPSELIGDKPEAQGARVKFWRMQTPGLTQKKLGKMVGLSGTGISSIELGVQADSSKLYKIAAALKVSHQYLKDGKGNPRDNAAPVQLISDAAPPLASDILESLNDMDPIEREVLENRLRREIEQIKSMRRRRAST